MSIEDALAKLTAAVEANTAALKGGKPAAAAAETKAEKPADKPKTETTEAKGPSRAEVNALLGKVKDKFDMAAAKTIIKDVGGVDKMADIPEGKFAAIVTACNGKLGGGSDGDGL
jgi:hypothetical protein